MNGGDFVEDGTGDGSGADRGCGYGGEGTRLSPKTETNRRRLALGATNGLVTGEDRKFHARET